MHKRMNVGSVIHYSLFVISAYMSILMFIIIGNSLETKLALILLAIILEVSKILDLQNSNANTNKRFIHLISYIIKASLSIIASVGLVITLIHSQENTNKDRRKMTDFNFEIYDENISYWETEIGNINQTIDILNENLARNPEGYGTASKLFVSQIEILQDRKLKYKNELHSAQNMYIDKLQEVKLQEEITISNMFTELGALINFSASHLKIIVFSLIMILIETSIALSNPIDQKLLSQNELNKMSFGESKTKKMSNSLGQKKCFDSKGLAIAKEIAKIQIEKESKGEKCYTYSEIAKRLNLMPYIIGNTYRRHIIPTFKKNGYKTFKELNTHWEYPNG